jgi:hypothetical protein
VDDINIRRLGWAGHITRIGDEKTLKKRLSMGNFITQGQWENQEHDARTSSGGTHRRS